MEMTTIANTICNYKEASIEGVMGKSRQWHFCSVRHMIWYFAYYHFGFTYQQIAAFSKRDHTTVISGANRINTFLPLYDDVRQEVEQIKHLLTNQN
jgi:chromosomal replication initiation ATPase DnaA